LGQIEKEERVVGLDLQAGRRPLAWREDPAETGNELVALAGYLGASTNGRWRLYRDLSLTCWFEIDEDDIRDTETVAIDGAPFPVTLTWLERGATLTARTSPPDAGVSDFLRNPFTPEDLVAVSSESWGVNPTMSKLHYRSKCY
jgi:hypothetical protein